MEKIELIGVNKSFKEEKVLKDICLTLTDNKIYGFVGRNGSGKSVLFKCNLTEYMTKRTF